MTFFLPYWVCQALALSWLAGGHRSAFWSEVYDTMLCFPMTLTIFSTFLKPFGKPFKVSAKGETKTGLTFNPVVGVPLLALMAFVRAGGHLRAGECALGAGPRDFRAGHRLVVLFDVAALAEFPGLSGRAAAVEFPAVQTPVARHHPPAGRVLARDSSKKFPTRTWKSVSTRAGSSDRARRTMPRFRV